MTDIREHPPPATAPAAPAARAAAATGPGRVAGLDGLRGLAALYVVLYHIFLRAWPGYPGASHAPVWAVWFSYGRGAVAVFIVLSGFSLGLGPARSGWRLESIATYAHRRAWRILPPYWAALGFSLVMTWYVLAQPGLPVPNGKSVVVYGSLVQDVFAVGSPNRSFWSIAIEAQLYVLLPLLLLLVRRVSAPAMVGMVAAIVVTIGVLGPHIALMNTALVKFTPDLAVLFAVGVLAAGIVTAGERTRSRPWAGYAVAAAVPPIVLMVVKGSVWSYFNLFWLDLAWAPAIGCFLAAVATSRPRFVVRFLNSRVPRSVGSCSYSLYLTHLPIVIAVSYGVVLGRVPAGTPVFFVLAAIVAPLTVCFARLFGAMFEIPFQRHRGWTPLLQAMSARLRQCGRMVRAARPADRGQIRLAAILGSLSTAALLGVVSAAAGLSIAGWIAGLAAGSAATALIVTARLRSDQPTIFPADWVSLTRAVLCAGVASLVAASFGGPVSITALVTLSAVALALDAVDGQVARRTGTATAVGGLIDGEVDAFLILVLSIVVSQAYGSWVLVIGAARYALLLAGWLIPWLAAPLPPRYWRKVVAAVQGIVLTTAASGLLGRLPGMIAVAAALLLLAESFGRDVIWLYRAGAGPRARMAWRLAIVVLALALVWFDLIAPGRAWQFTPAAFARIPLEGLVLVAVALVLPARPRRTLAVVAGILLSLLTFAKILNIAFYEFADRAFNPVYDWSSIPPALGVIRVTIGPLLADILLAAIALGLVLLVGAIIAATIHVTTVAARHRRSAVRGLAAVTAVWAACAGLSLQLSPGSPVASTSAAGLAVSQVRSTQAAFANDRQFERAIHSPDAEASIPSSDLLTGLRGKDVIIAFVEGYGQVSLQGPGFSRGIDAELSQASASLARAGWSTQSAWFNAPSYGGTSQLAHSTLQAGVWVNSVQRYSELIGTSRFTLSDAFAKAAWRTVSDSPSNGSKWAPGNSFYHYDQLLDRYNVGYRGPAFSYASMPDQYTLAEFQRLELAPGHKPVMAEIDLVSSHWPWAPLPAMVPWNKVGNGSIFDPMPAESESPVTIDRSASTVRHFYGQSMRYSLRALTSWVTEANDPNLVLILLGDEQPDSPITSPGQASHEVPVSIIARDPSVFRQISSWRWQGGLLPGRDAPLEQMSAFRNQFLTAFSTPSSEAGCVREGGSCR